MVRAAFTPIETKILQILGDGMPHTAKEIIGLVDPEWAPYNLESHISHLRIKLRPIGHDILCVTGNHVNVYRHVRILVSPSGRKA